MSSLKLVAISSVLFFLAEASTIKITTKQKEHVFSADPLVKRYSKTVCVKVYPLKSQKAQI